MTSVRLRRTVRWTARTSGLLFAAAQAASALRPAAETSRRFYVAFLIAHAAHFAAVLRYAMITGGRGLFPGGRNLDQAGGWPTVIGIYLTFAALALAGWPTQTPPCKPGLRLGDAAAALIGAMFVGTHLGQLSRARWRALPATVIAAGVAARVRASHRQGDGWGRGGMNPT